MRTQFLPEYRRLTLDVGAFLKDEEGPVAVEYAILVGLIAALVAGTAIAVGTNLVLIFEAVLAGLKA